MFSIKIFKEIQIQTKFRGNQMITNTIDNMNKETLKFKRMGIKKQCKQLMEEQKQCLIIKKRKQHEIKEIGKLKVKIQTIIQIKLNKGFQIKEIEHPLMVDK